MGERGERGMSAFMRARLRVCVCTRARVLHAALHSTIFTKFRHIYIGEGEREKGLVREREMELEREKEREKAKTNVKVKEGARARQ